MAAKFMVNLLRNLNDDKKMLTHHLRTRLTIPLASLLGALSTTTRTIRTIATNIQEKHIVPAELPSAFLKKMNGAMAAVEEKFTASGETGSGNTVTDDTTSKKKKRNRRSEKPAAGDFLSAKVDEVVSGETVLGKTVINDTTPKKRNKKKKKVAGDILSAKINEIVSGEMVPDKVVTDKTCLLLYYALIIA
ncbi:hypothetical protein Tco_0417814 [Tanacetum coccineum]